MAQVRANARRPGILRPPGIVVIGSSHARGLDVALRHEWRKDRRFTLGGWRPVDFSFKSHYVPGGGAVEVTAVTSELRLLSFKPNVIVVLAGSNDSRFLTASDEADSLECLARQTCLSANRFKPHVRTQVLMLGLLPRAESVPVTVTDRYGPRMDHASYNPWAAEVNETLGRVLRRPQRNQNYNRDRITFVRQPPELFLGRGDAHQHYPDLGHIDPRGRNYAALGTDGVHLTPHGVRCLAKSLLPAVVRAYERSLRL